ncbi:hypothetical protein Mapa_004871 [Marchantia paleacea]|nr:hypothetical protein Mapa_004871 [Marchantia paleacea]
MRAASLSAHSASLLRPSLHNTPRSVTRPCARALAAAPPPCRRPERYEAHLSAALAPPSICYESPHTARYSARSVIPSFESLRPACGLQSLPLIVSPRASSTIHRAPPPGRISHSSPISQESYQISLLISADPALSEHCRSAVDQARYEVQSTVRYLPLRMAGRPLQCFLSLWYSCEQLNFKWTGDRLNGFLQLVSRIHMTVRRLAHIRVRSRSKWARR